MLTHIGGTWDECRSFVREVCAGRPASHGLAHMEAVTQLAVLIAGFEGITAPDELRDITRVAMLHDVADHKYDLDGTLEPRVKAFVQSSLFPDDADAAGAAWSAIDAISYSKESRRGMRYFAEALGPRWTRIRDIVSDADKLLAIGEDGLERCWHYQLERHEGLMQRAKAEGRPVPAPMTPAEVVADVVQHAHEKLLRLSMTFMVTQGGRFLAAPKQRDMEVVLEHWKQSPPQTLAYEGVVHKK